MAEEDQSEASQQTAGSDEEKARAKQASPCVIEIHDSTTECEEEARPSKVPTEEKAFVASLHSFMKDKGTPIERIPHLGFKQIDLWMIYKAVEKLGGYESVTTGRLWKRVYDELGGSPGSTSAATCTRRHYERLVLPFERHMKGEDNKPLPPSKPRKPYKRNQEPKANKVDVKRKRSHSEREIDSELLPQRSPDAVCQSETMMNPHFALWPPSSDRRHPERSQPSRTAGDFPVNGHILQIPASGAWVSHLPSAAGEVISPLEKKKRMAQASLNVPPSSQREDKERPSVIHCSQSPARASSSRNCNSSEGSPLPLSSSSSRSSSPLSVSSEESPTRSGDKPRPSSTSAENCSSAAKMQEDNKVVSCSQTPTNTSAHKKDTSQISCQTFTADCLKSHIKDSAWKPYPKETVKYFSYPFHASPSLSTSSSSFTKVIPKSVQLLRPAPIRPTYKLLHSGLLQTDNSLTFPKKLGGVNPWPFPTEKRDRSRTVQQKVPPAQQGMSQSAGPLPASCVLSSYDKSGRDSRHHQPVHPAFFPHRMRLPPSQLIYHSVPVGPSHSALFGPAVYPYPYSIPLSNPQAGYPLPAMNAVYPHKL